MRNIQPRAIEIALKHVINTIYKLLIFRCELCKVNLSNEEIMQFHLSSPGHKVGLVFSQPH